MSVILISLAFTLCLTGTSIIFSLYLKFLEVTEESETLVVRYWKTSTVRYHQHATNTINVFTVKTKEVQKEIIQQEEIPLKEAA